MPQKIGLHGGYFLPVLEMLLWQANTEQATINYIRSGIDCQLMHDTLIGNGLITVVVCVGDGRWLKVMSFLTTIRLHESDAGRMMI